jgi:uncharacterized protein (DUF983 family)
VKKDRRPIFSTLFRSLRLRCPACGASSIVKSPFHIKHHCTSCHALFKREDGFFVGAIMANVIVTEFVVLVFCLFLLLAIGADYQRVLPALFVIALLFPVAFYHHSWSFWLGFDYLIESLPKYYGPDPAKQEKAGD